MTYTLYNRLGSGGFAVEAALSIAGEPFRLELLDSKPSTNLPESFRAINPRRQVPALILPDGTLMTETAAMLIHLAERHPDSELGPALGTPARAQLLRWCVYLTANVYEAVLRKSYPHRATTDPDGADAVSAAAVAHMQATLQIVEDTLTPDAYLLGPTMSVADIYLAMLNAWHRDGQGLMRCEALTHRIAAHPVIAPIWQRNFDHRLPIRWGR